MMFLSLRVTIVVHTSEDRKVRVHGWGKVTKSLWRGESQSTAYELAQAIHAIEAGRNGEKTRIKGSNL